MTRYPIIGLTGLPCTGKSFVGGILVGLGAAVLRTDQLGHAVLEESDIKDRLVARYGDAVLGPDGRIDRAYVAGRVFAAPGDDAAHAKADAEREWLESLAHPRITARARAWIAARRHAQPVVVEAALLAQSGLAEVCDHILVLVADDDVRCERAAQHRHWTEAMLHARERGLVEPIEALRAPDAAAKLGLRGRIVFLENNARPDTPAPMERLVEPLRALLNPMPE